MMVIEDTELKIHLFEDELPHFVMISIVLLIFYLITALHKIL